MIRFAAGAFVAAFLGASLFDRVREAAFRAGVQPDGLIAVLLIAIWVAALFSSVAFAYGSRRKAVRDERSERTEWPYSAWTWRPSRPPGGPRPDVSGGRLDPEGSVVRQIRELCREDARREIARMRYLERDTGPKDGLPGLPMLPPLGSVEGAQRPQDASDGAISVRIGTAGMPDAYVRHIRPNITAAEAA